MKIDIIEMRVEITINGEKTLIRKASFDAKQLSHLLFPELFKINCDLMSKEFQEKFQSIGYEF